MRVKLKSFREAKTTFGHEQTIHLVWCNMSRVSNKERKTVDKCLEYQSQRSYRRRIELGERETEMIVRLIFAEQNVIQKFQTKEVSSIN